MNNSLGALAVDAANARQDRILVSFRRWTFTGTIEQFSAFGDHLSHQYEEAGRTRRLFNKRSGVLPFSPRWVVAGGKQERDFIKPGTPLFSGSLRAYFAPRDGTGTLGRWDLEADLALNPTRWVTFETGELTRKPKFEWFDVPINIFAETSGRAREYSLTGGGNVIAGSQRRQALAHPSVWRVQLERYVHGTLRYLGRRFEAAAEHTGGTLHQRSDDVRTKTVETYWELGATNALEFVRNLELPLRAQASRSHVRWWPLDPRSPFIDRTTEIGTVENSAVIRIQMAKGIALRVYAKLRDRVRLEVIHTAREAGHFGGRSDDVEALFGWLDFAAKDASSRLNRVLRSLEQYMQSSSYDHPPHQVAIEILRALRDCSSGEDALHILVRDGRLVRSPQSSFGTVITSLVQQGILERSEQTGNDHIYIPTARYRRGLDLLRQGAATERRDVEER